MVGSLSVTLRQKKKEGHFLLLLLSLKDDQRDPGKGGKEVASSPFSPDLHVCQSSEEGAPGREGTGKRAKMTTANLMSFCLELGGFGMETCLGNKNDLNNNSFQTCCSLCW